MRFYNGAFTHEQILKMPWLQFEMYQDYMFYLEAWKTEEGAKENKMLNRQDEIRYNKSDNMAQSMEIFKQQLFKKGLK